MFSARASKGCSGASMLAADAQGDRTNDVAKSNRHKSGEAPLIAIGSHGTTRSLVFLNALLLASAIAVPAYADIETVVVTAEKRAADVQTVPVAISVFTSEKRDAIGITSVQDMTNFTPGLAYQTSLDRVFLRGVGRQTNSQAADTPVANYDDGLFETFAVAAGRSSLDLDRVEVLRGPQGTLSGRNALAGALNQITRHPNPDNFEGEARAMYGAFSHYNAEISLTGPIDDVWAYRIYGLYDKQTEGWATNIVPNAIQGTNDPLFTGKHTFPGPTPMHAGGDQGNVIDEWYVDAQIQARFNPHFEMWTKVQAAQWWNGAGGPGADLEGWTPADYPTFEVASGGLYNAAGYGCTQLAGNPYFTNAAPVVSRPTSIVTALPSATACTNPGFKNPWHQARMIQTQVRLPSYWSLNTQWTYHADGFDVKWIGGGSYYRYHLSTMLDVHTAPIQSYVINGHYIDNRWQFNPEEENSFLSNEINLISTGDSPLQWVVGAYQFSQQANQPGDAYNQFQPEVNGGTAGHPFGDGLLGPPADGGVVFCSSPAFLGGNGVGTGGVCAPNTTYRSFDTLNNIHDHSYAGFGQVDWQVTDQIKLTLGARYSYDRKFGTETARVVCYFGFCGAFGAQPDMFFGTGLFAQPIDTTQTGIVVASGVPTVPEGVTGPTTYDPATGYATRHLDASWDGITGTAGVEWQPDTDTLVYAKYGRGYKDGGYYEGANTALVTRPFTEEEAVDSGEIGAKRTWDDWITTNVAIFYYAYKNLQLPLTFISTQGVVTLNQTTFFNVPRSVSQGAELEVTAQPIDDLSILFNYSYNDAHVTEGIAFDPADPNALEPGAKPLYTDLQCATIVGACSTDVYTAGTAPGGIGWNKPQDIRGNDLPNAARNKVAVNVMYTFHSDWGSFTPSVSYIWRDKQYGTLFTRSYNEAPAWYQVDARVRWVSEDENYEVILFGKNVTNQIIYDVGAIGTRLAGTNNFACVGGGVPGTVFGLAFMPVCNFVQGLNGPTGWGPVRGEDSTGHVKTYQVAPPALWGIEFHYKFD
jgi:iron complex outermembrane receptor protein